MKLASKIAVGLLASLSLTAAMAQTAPPKAPLQPRDGPRFEHKDITRAEVLAKAAERFDAADTNKDGVLTKDERRAARQEMREHRGQRPQDFEHPPGHAPGDHKGPPPPRDGGPGPANGVPAPQR